MKKTMAKALLFIGIMIYFSTTVSGTSFAKGPLSAPTPEHASTTNVNDVESEMARENYKKVKETIRKGAHRFYKEGALSKPDFEKRALKLEEKISAIKAKREEATKKFKAKMAQVAKKKDGVSAVVESPVQIHRAKMAKQAIKKSLLDRQGKLQEDRVLLGEIRDLIRAGNKEEARKLIQVWKRSR